VVVVAAAAAAEVVAEAARQQVAVLARRHVAAAERCGTRVVAALHQHAPAHQAVQGPRIAAVLHERAPALQVAAGPRAPALLAAPGRRVPVVKGTATHVVQAPEQEQGLVGAGPVRPGGPPTMDRCAIPPRAIVRSAGNTNRAAASSRGRGAAREQLYEGRVAVALSLGVVLEAAKLRRCVARVANAQLALLVPVAMVLPQLAGPTEVE
jgi:hypothetical protein